MKEGDEEDEMRKDARTEEGQRAHIYSSLPGGCRPLCSSRVHDGDR